MKKLLPRALSLFLCLCLLAPSSALAEEPGAPGVLRPEELQAMLDTYIADHRLNPNKVSVGFVYTATGESWYYNPDTWFYSASMYKVPLMMLLAEKEYKGEITRDTKLKGLTLGEAESMILTYSHNDYAHLMMSVLADTEPNCRELYKEFVDLPEDYYDPDFHDYSYFTARFMTQVMTTLYNDPDRFPNVIDCLKLAQPGEYFRITLGQYEIAQKYGSFLDYSARDFNHTTGIIYLPHPIILTVMTQDAPAPQGNIADIAKLFADYSLQADTRLEAYEAEREADRLAVEAEERRLEEERLAEEQAAQAAAVSTEAPTEAAAPTEETQPPAAIPSSQAAPQEPNRLYILLAATAVLLTTVFLFLRRGRR